MNTPEIITVRTEIETIYHEGGPPPETPHLRGFIAAVAKNPFAGKYVEDIAPMMDALKPLGMRLAAQLIKALRGKPSSIEAYGKGAIVGSAGETEHAALWHVPGGYAMRELLGDAKAIVPSTKKIGTVDTRLDVPLTHINAAYVRSHFDAIECGVPGAPAADEIIYILTMATGSRVHARVGGLQADEIKGEDGLR
jgi:hypothetical protein